MIRNESKLKFIFLAILFCSFFGWVNSSLAYDSPIGIPEPLFGIENEMTSSGCANWPSAATNGCYYVDRTSGAATDTNNANGYPDRPRLTVPTSLAAGSYVEIHGTGYSAPTTWTLNGSEAQPIFIYGVGVSKPTFTGSQSTHELRGQWFIIGGIKWVDTRIRFGQGGVSDSHHAVLRHIEHTGWTGLGTTSMIAWNAAASAHHDNVIYDSDIHDNGPLATETDIDQHGVAVGPNNYNFWLLDSRLYRNTGDGIQINATNVANMASTHHIHVGRSEFYENRQVGFWTKQATDVIFSENISHDHRPSVSSAGACAGMQYGPERVWFLFNTLYNCDIGIRVASDNDGHGANLYIIGNLIYNISPVAPNYATSDNSTTAAISLWDMDNRYIVSNTIWNSVAGIKMNNSAVTKAVIVDNIIGQHTYADDREIWIPSITDQAGSEMRNNVVIGDRISWGQSAVETLVQFQTRTGKGESSTTNTPTFVDSGSNNFNLSNADTAAKDAGAVSDVYALFSSLYGVSIEADKAGTSRPQGSAWDIGAFEYDEGGGPDITPPAAPQGLAVS